MFRITWEGATINEVVTDIEEGSPLLFHTTKTIVKLVDEEGNGIEGGNVSYFRDEWKDAGPTDATGMVMLEFFQREYTFRMEYSGVTLEKTLTVSAPETIVEFEWDGGTLKNSEPVLPDYVKSLTLYPNPSIGEVNLSVILEESTRLDITILDLSGKAIRQLFSGTADEGNHQFTWNRDTDTGERVDNGVYLCRIIADGQQTIKTIVLVR